MNLAFKNLKHIYKSPAAESRPVLDIPDWEIKAGQQILLKGVSGSGKTTLFNITAGLMHPTEGKVLLGDQALYDLNEATRDRFRAKHIGYTFQNHYLLPNLNALENVIMPIAFAEALPRSQWKPKATEILEKMGLGDHLKYRPGKMSTGQRLRVAIARALVNQPSIILADEPTAALDSASADSTMDTIQAICRENNAILIVASHDPALEKRFDTIAHLSDQAIRLEERVTA